MAVNKSCPIVFKRVDKNIIRINALIIFSFISCYILTLNPVLLVLILADFIIRVFFGLKYSPICFFIKRGLRVSGVKPHLINAGPKIFAARIGLIFSISVLISYLFGYTTLSIVLASVFLIAVGLEAFFNYCLACEIYPYYYGIFGRD